MEPIQVLIHDPHPGAVMGVRTLINMQPGLRVAAESGVFEQTLEDAGNCNAGLLIMEIEERNTAEIGLERMAIFHANYPDIPILVLTIHDETVHARTALRMGAKGFMMKSEPPERIVEAMHTVLSGRIFLSEAVTRQLLLGQVGAGIGFFPRFDGDIGDLSPREMAVFRFLGMGMSTREIAEAMKVNLRTVYAHTSNIRKKMKLERSRDLSSLADAWLNWQA